MEKLRSWLKKQHFLLWLGFTLTFGYFGLIIQIYGDRLFDLKFMPLNEVGDFLAGAFGPVAFFWLVTGYLMQNKELSMNRDELKISRIALENQAEELKNSAMQQAKVANLMQIEIEKTKNAELPVLNIGKCNYYLKFEHIPVIMGDRIAKSNEIKIVLENTGKAITNSRFLLSLKGEDGHIIDTYTSEKTILSSDSTEEYFIKIDQDITNDRFIIYFDFLTISQRFTRYEYTGSIIKEDDQKRVSLVGVDHL